MKKFAVIFIFIISLVLSNNSNATLITDSSLLTSDHYVTYVGDGLTIDFAWASSVNVEYWGDPDLDTTNRLYAPGTHAGWGYADGDDLDILFANFTLENFSNDDGTYIQAVSFWNTIFDDIKYSHYHGYVAAEYKPTVKTEESLEWMQTMDFKWLEEKAVLK